MTRLPIESIRRPERWSVPFSSEMNDADVDRLLTIPPFSEMDPNKFRGKITLPGILKNDTRLISYQAGDIVVRQGDWGNSAFFILNGSVRVELGAVASGESLPEEVLGRRETQRKGFFQLLAQLWKNPRDPEVREVAGYNADPRIGTRGQGQQTRIYLQDVSAVLDKYNTAALHPGQLFGEIAALGRTPRTATVFADEEAELLEVRWQGLRELLRRDQALQTHVDHIFRERALQTFLLNTPIFDGLSQEEMQELSEQARLETHGQFDWAGSFKRLVKKGQTSGIEHEPLIAEEGHHPNGVVIVRSGLARVCRKRYNGHQTVGYLTPGQVYGLEEIAEGWASGQPQPLKNSLRAIGMAAVVVAPTPCIEKFLLDKHSKSEARKRVTQIVPATEKTERLEPEFVEFMVQNRYINGSATMLIDMDRCTRCDDCVRACATAHDNNPRFLRSGPIHNNLMVANACMHCEDPVCMIECPTGAIHRNLQGGQVVVNDRTCIGCSACSNNCP